MRKNLSQRNCFFFIWLFTNSLRILDFVRHDGASFRPILQQGRKGTPTKQTGKNSSARQKSGEKEQRTAKRITFAVIEKERCRVIEWTGLEIRRTAHAVPWV